MSQELSTQSDNYNPYAEYETEGAGSRIIGDLLKYEKGSFYAGRDGAAMPIGTKLVANIPGFTRGWMCWKGGKPVDAIMLKLGEGKPPSRADLGSLDSSIWELDDKGQPKDPWQESSTLILADPVTKQQYTFSTSSKGGRESLRRTVSEFGAQYRQRPGKLPLVTLGTDSYVHPNRAYGRVHFPVLKIVDWVDAEGATEELPSATITTLKPRTQDDFNMTASQAKANAQTNIPDAEIPF